MEGNTDESGVGLQRVVENKRWTFHQLPTWRLDESMGSWGGGRGGVGRSGDITCDVIVFVSLEQQGDTQFFSQRRKRT